MSKYMAIFLIIVGLTMTLGGCEISVDDEQMLTSAVFAILGILTMYAGLLGVRNADFYHRG